MLDRNKKRWYLDRCGRDGGGDMVVEKDDERQVC